MTCFGASRSPTWTMALLIGVLAGCAHAPSQPASEADERTVTPTRRKTDDPQLRAQAEGLMNAFFTNLDTFEPRFTAKLAAQVPHEKTAALQSQVLSQCGAPAEIVSESTWDEKGLPVYAATLRMSKCDASLEFRLTLTPDRSAIAGFWIRPSHVAASTPYLEYQTKTELHLPFEGEWFVVWGGRTLAQNQHEMLVSQYFAYDLLKVGPDGLTHQGSGQSNADFFAFGQPIRTAAAGKVVTVVDGIDDNAPGKMNPSQPVGNHVVIDHGNGELSLYAHLQRGSIQVKVGDTVAQGQALARCGNSGNSSEPHLHFQLQDSATFEGTRSLPAPFSGCLVNGQPVTRAELEKGQRIQALEAGHATPSM